MVRTPGIDPFEEAAESEPGRLSRSLQLAGSSYRWLSAYPKNFLEAEKVIRELQQLQKPLCYSNSTRPYTEEVHELAEELSDTYGVTAVPLDCQQMSKEDVYQVLEEALYEFPVQEVNISLPKWVDEVEEDFWLRSRIEGSIRGILEDVRKVRDIDTAMNRLADIEYISLVTIKEMNLGTGIASIDLAVPNCNTRS